MQTSVRSWMVVALLLLLVSFIAAAGCDDDDTSRYNAPADHTVSKDGDHRGNGLGVAKPQLR